MVKPCISMALPCVCRPEEMALPCEYMALPCFKANVLVSLAHAGFIYYNYNTEYEKEDMAYDGRH